MRAVLILIAILALAAPALMRKPAAHAAPLSEHVTIRLPAGANGPVPAVLMFAGCGGVRQVQDDYAETALEAGWAAVIVDSHAARGIGRLGARLTVCTALRLRGAERAADVFEALEIVRADARLDPSRTVLTGWSHGGWTILDALVMAEAGDAPALSGVQAAFLLYPYCGLLTIADDAPIGGVPVTMILAGRDRVVSAAACRDLAEERRAEGAEITIIEEPALTHAFDAPDQPADPRMRYDADGAQRARARFAAVLESDAALD
jgi:dienelactone hydrolase